MVQVQKEGEDGHRHTKGYKQDEEEFFRGGKEGRGFSFLLSSTSRGEKSRIFFFFFFLTCMFLSWPRQQDLGVRKTPSPPRFSLSLGLASTRKTQFDALKKEKSYRNFNTFSNNIFCLSNLTIMLPPLLRVTKEIPSDGSERRSIDR